MRKKVLLLCYLLNNVGDDLFVSILLKRYKNIEFIYYCEDDKYTKVFSEYKNLTVISGFDETNDDYVIDDVDCCIYIGGSIFREIKGGVVKKRRYLDLIKAFKSSGKPFFYVSSNFGPTMTEDFYLTCEESIKSCTSIVFRDTYSYNLFKDFDSVHYAPDLVFSLNLRPAKKIEKSIGFSVLDLSKRKSENDLNLYVDKYQNMLVSNIEKFLGDGYSVYLFSFCKDEGDEIAINRVLSRLPDDSRKLVKVVKYTNLYKFLKKYSQMEKFICTRFHSVVLSMLFRQELLILSYSQKIDKLCDDIGNVYVKIPIDKDIENFAIDYEMFRKMNDRAYNKYTKESVKQLQWVDRFLGYNKIFKRNRIIEPNIGKKIKSRKDRFKNKIKKKLGV